MASLQKTQREPHREPAGFQKSPGVSSPSVSPHPPTSSFSQLNFTIGNDESRKKLHFWLVQYKKVQSFYARLKSIVLPLFRPYDAEKVGRKIGNIIERLLITSFNKRHSGIFSFAPETPNGLSFNESMMDQFKLEFLEVTENKLAFTENEFKLMKDAFSKTGADPNYKIQATLFGPDVNIKIFTLNTKPSQTYFTESMPKILFDYFVSKNSDLNLIGALFVRYHLLIPQRQQWMPMFAENFTTITVEAFSSPFTSMTIPNITGNIFIKTRKPTKIYTIFKDDADFGFYTDFFTYVPEQGDVVFAHPPFIKTFVQRFEKMMEHFMWGNGFKVISFLPDWIKEDAPFLWNSKHLINGDKDGHPEVMPEKRWSAMTPTGKDIKIPSPYVFAVYCSSGWPLILPFDGETKEVDFLIGQEILSENVFVAMVDEITDAMKSAILNKIPLDEVTIDIPSNIDISYIDEMKSSLSESFSSDLVTRENGDRVLIYTKS